jgi:hydrogenase-4 component F
VLTFVLVVGLLVAFAALLLRVHGLVFGKPTGPTDPVKASYIPLFLHLILVFIAGLWLPAAVVGWFHGVAKLLG